MSTEVHMSGRRLLVVGAHSADFVWRASGTIARHTANGGDAVVVAMSYGERGESGELWQTPGQTEANVKRIRHAEAERAAGILGARFEAFDLGDYPLQIDEKAGHRLVELILDFQPHVVLTHPDADPFNPDHPTAHHAVRQARLLASGAGVASGFRTTAPSEFLVFEPHQPELCGFVPTVYVDVTPSLPARDEAMSSMAAQGYLYRYYTQRAEQRGNHARKVTGDSAILHAEAFQRLLPNVVGAL
jgi:4-oxalomesaconate hydratase